MTIANAHEEGEEGRAILALLASQPTPEAVLKLRPSASLQARISMLLMRSKASSLSSTEQAEFDRYERLEHLERVCIARIDAGHLTTLPREEAAT